ncbi:MAG: serine hydrolase, partial [Actinomycetota bacterium]
VDARPPGPDGVDAAPEPPEAIFPDPDWTEGDPADHGLDLAKLDEAAAVATGNGSECLLVFRHGVLVYERYFAGTDATTIHESWSLAKSYSSTLVGIAVERGQLAIDDLVCAVAPEFTGTSLDGATVRHVIDMTAGTDFDEDYAAYEAAYEAADPGSSVPLIEYERHAGYRPLGAVAPIGTLGHFRTYGNAYPHGSWFQYRSPLTNIAARLLEVVNNLRYPDIVSRDLWCPLGQEFDADIMLDPLGHPVVEGGVSCTLRDLARFGLAYLNDGRANGRQVIPKSWVDDTRFGDDAALSAFAASPHADPDSRGWSMYRNAFWVMERGQVFSGLGIFGQYCWVHRPSATVIARFSTFPSAAPADVSAEVMRGFDAVAESLG